jgi:hypothetical protein
MVDILLKQRVINLEELMADLMRTTAETSLEVARLSWEMREFKEESRRAREKSDANLAAFQKRSEADLQAFREENQRAQERAEANLAASQKKSEAALQAFREEWRASLEASQEKSEANLAAFQKKSEADLRAFREENQRAQERAEANLAASQKKSEADLQAFREEWRASLEASQEKSEANLQAFREEWRASLEVYRAEWRAEARQMNRQWGELANKMGTLVEDLVSPSLPRILRRVSPCPEGAEVASAIRVRRPHPTERGRTQEFDALVSCGEYLLLNETKSTLSTESVDKLLAKIALVRDYLPEYQQHKIIGAIASLYVDDGLIQYASRQGVLVLAMGDEELMEIKNEKGFMPREF